MPGGDAERVAREFFSMRFTEWPGDAFARLAEDVVINPSDGHIYVGHEGYARWYEEHVGEHRDREFQLEGSEVLREHWVLLKGAVEDTLRDSQRRVQPGCWLVHVREGLIAAVLYYRTEQAAREALSARQ
jgi:hypothetical protein